VSGLTVAKSNDLKDGPRIAALTLPKSGDANQTTTVEGPGVFVIIGANGAGKTRLGTWVEFRTPATVHRVSAQKSLTMPESVSPASLERAEASLLWGHDRGTKDHKPGHRWASNPNTALLNDYEKLMIYLFSDDYEKSIAYRLGAKEASGRITPPETKLDIVKRLWESVLPTKQLVIGSGSVKTAAKGKDTSYSGAEMSDGERVIFYLIGEALSAQKDGMLIIDEPELHLHKSVQAPLWDAIEGQRPDLAFVYLTHDVGFAASRSDAPKICLTAFDGTNWEWYVAPNDARIPEDILLQIIGGRRPVIFVEGEETSLDYFFLRHVYDIGNLVPAGSAEHVIHAVASFASFEHLHQLKCFGLIDRDYRDAERIRYLLERGVYVMTMAEIENVLIAEPVVRVAAAELAHDEVDAIVERIKAMVLQRLADERERVISEIAAARIESGFLRFDAKARGKEALRQSLEVVLDSANAEAIYDVAQQEIDGIIQSKDYARALAVYGNKGLVSSASQYLGLKPREYTVFLKRLALSRRNEALIAALKQQLPKIPLQPAAEQVRATATTNTNGQDASY
jgi:hypothetical protein